MRDCAYCGRPPMLKENLVPESPRRGRRMLCVACRGIELLRWAENIVDYHENAHHSRWSKRQKHEEFQTEVAIFLTLVATRGGVDIVPENSEPKLPSPVWSNSTGSLLTTSLRGCSTSAYWDDPSAYSTRKQVPESEARSELLSIFDPGTSTRDA